MTQDALAEVPVADALTEGGDFPSKQRCTYLELVVALASGHSYFLMRCIEDVFYGCLQVTQDALAEVPAADALTEGSPSEQRCTFLELALALAGSLDAPAVSMLYKAVKSALQVPRPSLSSSLHDANTLTPSRA